MTQTPSISPADVSASLMSGMRASSSHDKFSTDKVQLAFGEDGDKRILHVTSVARGRDCACHCPACSEELIAKQGDKKAWHFAHASGGSCKDALSAAFAKFMAQILNEGRSVNIPSAVFQWGHETHVSGPSLEIVFDEARAIQPGGIGPYEVRAVKRSDAGNEHVIRILFQAVKKPRRPSIDDLRSEGVSTLEVDLFSALQEMVAEGADFQVEEEWLSDQLLHVADRKWLWNLQQDRLYQQMKQERLGPRLQALKRLEAMHVNDDPIEAERLIERLGLSRLLDMSPIRGARVFGPSTKGWKALFLRDLIIMPFVTEAKDILINDVGIDRRAITKWMASRKVLRVPEVTRAFASDNDRIEFQKIAGDIRKPIDVVEDYLKQLWEEDVVRAKPTKDLARNQKGHFDDRLKPHGMPFWLTSNKVIRIVYRTLVPEVSGAKGAAQG